MRFDISLRKRIALEAARKIRRNNIVLHPLRQLFWECTLRCNLHCRHCGSDCQRNTEQEDMPMQDFLDVIKTITPHVNPHEVSIIISGGEPLLRNDLEECGQVLYEEGYPWGLVSNGYYLSRARLDNLMAAGLHSMTISLDGFENEHNWLRGDRESFKRAVKAIKMLADDGELLWDVVTCINRRNYPQLVTFRNFLVNLGVRNWRIFTIFPVGRAVHSAELQLTKEEFVGLMEFIKKMRKAGGMHIDFACEGFLGEYEGEVRDHFYACNAGITIASILADGTISACPSIRSDFHQGNIYKDNFMEVWENGFQQFRNREWAKRGQCADCSFFRYCEGNGMHLHDNNGDLLLCHYKRLR